MNMVQTAPGLDLSLSLSDADIRRTVHPSYLAAGRLYEQRGRVQELRIHANGAVITATTQGSAPDPYTQRLIVSKSADGLRIVGTCSCPIGRNCKHVAAVLIAAQRRQHQRPPVAASLLRTIQSPPIRTAPTLVAPTLVAPTQAELPAEQLPPQIQMWLADFDQEEEELTEAFPAAMRSRIYYVLGVDPDSQGVPLLRIDPMTVTLRKDGGISTIKRYNLYQLQTPAKYLRPSDRLIVARLSRRTGHLPKQPDDDPSETLRRILQTGRARWQAADGVALREASERHGQVTWITRGDAFQQATLSLDEGLIGVRIPSPWYVDPQAGAMGPVGIDLPRGVVNRLLNAPAIPPESAAEVRARLSRRESAVAVPVPSELQAPERIQVPLQPHLRLINGTLPTDPSYGRGSARSIGNGLFEAPLARLSFQYGPIELPRSRRSLPRLTVQQGVIYEVVRDLAAEAGVLKQLSDLGFASVQDLVPVYYLHAHTDDFALRETGASLSWLQLVTQEVPRLRDIGWKIEIDESFPIQVVSTNSAIEAELIEGSGIDWLELHLGVVVDGQRVDLVPALIRLIARPEAGMLAEGPDDKPFILPLPDGRLLSLPMASIRPTLQALLELWAARGGDTEQAGIGFSRLDATALAELETRSGLIWRGGEALRDLGRKLQQTGGIPRAMVPTSFQATLRPYQSQGVDWLQFLGSAGLGGVLADDMGLGKTVQTLAHLMVDKAEGRLDRPSLIVCPTSLIPNWIAEARRFAPDLSVLALHGPARKSRFKDIIKFDVILSTYPLLSRDHEILTAQEWHAVILDEAQSIKNPNAETTRLALRLKARQRLCLSGTPLQNHLGELWSLFDFLAPGFLGGQKSFKAQYRTPIEKHGDVERQTLLNRRVRPFMLRRTKEDVITELPPKTEINEPVEMEAVQRSIYEAIRMAMHAKVQAAIAQKGLARSGIIILDALLKMRQACCDPRLLKLQAVSRSKAGSAKLDRLMDMLEIMLSEGRRILLFSQFTEMLALIERRLADSKIDYVMLTGDTKDRAGPVNRFQRGDVPLFLISLKAGGVGLNLTAADTVIHYDPWWNPAVEDQATDRAHRIGQHKKVFVHRLVTLGTIEEKMEVLKEKKRAIVAGVMDAEHGGALNLTSADIEELFAPAL